MPRSRPALDRSAQGGPGLLLFLLMAVFSVAAALGAERIADMALARFRARAVAKAVPQNGAASLPPLLLLALLDIVGLAAIWLVANGAHGRVVQRNGPAKPRSARRS